MLTQRKLQKIKGRSYVWVREWHVRQQSWKRIPCTKERYALLLFKEAMLHFGIFSLLYGALSQSTHGKHSERERKSKAKDKNTYKNEGIAHTVIFVSFWHCYLGQLYLWVSWCFKETWLCTFILGDKGKLISSFWVQGGGNTHVCMNRNCVHATKWLDACVTAHFLSL